MHSSLLLVLLSQTPNPSPAPWLTPGLVLTALGMVVSAVVAIVVWSVTQDRRIEKRATKEEVEKVKNDLAKILEGEKKEIATQVQGIREAVVDLGKMIAAAKPRAECETCRRELDTKIVALHDEIRERPTKQSMNQAFEEIRHLTERVVAGEKVSLKLEGKVDAALAALVDLKAALDKVDGKLDRLGWRDTLKPPPAVANEEG